MKKFKKIFTLIILLYIILNMVVMPEVSISSAQKAIKLCLNVVIPSLFPFFAASSLFISLGYASYFSRYFSKIMKPFFNVSGCGALPLILGIISGYPIGASTSVKLYKDGYISKTEAERLLAFTNNSGPLFVLGAIGCGMLSSNTYGLIIYISHIISALIVGIVFSFLKEKTGNTCLRLTPAPERGIKKIGEALSDAVSFSVDNILRVCGFIILFSVVCSFIPSGKFYPFIYSLLEITGGINVLSSLPEDIHIKLPVISFFLSFSGISVLCQVCTSVLPAGLSIKPYITGKLLQGIFSFFITRVLIVYFCPYTEVSSIVSPLYSNILPKDAWQASMSIVLFAGLLLTLLLLLGYFLENKKKL